jgi:hypothetical protein
MKIDGHQNDRFGHQVAEERDHTGDTDPHRSLRDASRRSWRTSRTERRESRCRRN